MTPWLVRSSGSAREPRSASKCTTRVSRRTCGCGTRKPTTRTDGGLLLVDSIADSWHSGPSHLGGTVVSFVVADAWPA